MSVASEASLLSIAKEPLSLSNFQPGYAKEPYLNTPRSIEACQIHGVNPADLVEIPFREFRKDYPNDEEAALRRFERFDGVRKCLLEAVANEWKRIASRGTLTGISPSKKTSSEGAMTIIDVSPEAYTPLLEIQAKRLQKVEEQQYLGLKKMVVNQMNAAIKENKSKQIIAKQDGISEQNEMLKKKRMQDRENVLREQREEAKYKEFLQQKEVRLEQQRAAVEARKQKERRKEAEAAEKKRQQKREADRLLQEAYMKKLKEDDQKKVLAEAQAKTEKFETEAREKARKDAEEQERRQQDQVRQRNDMIEKIENAKREASRRAEEKRKMILDRIEQFDQKAETLKAEKGRRQKEEAQAKDQALQDKINQIRGLGDKVVEEKAMRTLETLHRKQASASKELSKSRGELERRQTIKKIKQDAFHQNLNRAKTAEAFRLKRIQDDLDVKDAKAKAIKDSMAAFQALREAMSETVAKTRGELQRDASRLNHKNRLNPDNLMDVVVDNTQTRLFPRLHHNFLPAGTEPAPTVSPQERQQSGSPNKSDHWDHDRPRSPLAHAKYTLHDFKEDRLTKDIVESRESIERRNADLLLPYAITLGASRRNLAQKDKLNKTAPVSGYRTGQKGAQSPAVSGTNAARNTILSAPGSRFVDQEAVANDDEILQKEAVGWDDDEYNGYEGAQIDDVEGNEPAIDGFDATDDDNLFFQPVPTLIKSHSERQSPKKQQKSRAPKPGAAFKPPPPKNDEFRREYSKDHPLAPGGTGKYQADRAGGKKHPVGWVESGQAVEGNANETPKYEKIVIHQTRNPQTDTAVKDVATWQAEIDAMRRQQNQALLKLLEEERLAEEDRGKMGKLVKDHEERHRLELVFSEERKRASERIIHLTRQHELNIKEVSSRLKDAESQ